ncbi:MAG: hypothetical protein ACRDSR_02190 [Pseudonocardiaceae bacterium]
MIMDHFAESPSSGSTPAETFRAAFPGRTPEGELSTLIVTRQGLGRDGRVWLTFDGAIRTTVVLTDGETGQLIGMLGSAKTRHPGETRKSQD